MLAVTDNSDPGSTPDFMSWLEKRDGRDVTTRTWLTVQRIAARLADPPFGTPPGSLWLLRSGYWGRKEKGVTP